MTVLELYNMALALLNEIDTDAKDYPRLKIPYINLLLAQSFTTENWIRRSKNLPMLESIPTLYRDSDLVPYDTAFVRECLPYALAAMLAVDEDRSLANVYSSMYESLAEKYLKIFSDTVDNVYEGVSE